MWSLKCRNFDIIIKLNPNSLRGLKEIEGFKEILIYTIIFYSVIKIINMIYNDLYRIYVKKQK